MRPFDPRILRVAPATRRPVATLAVVGVAQGVATIATAFALAALVVAVVRGSDLVGPALWTGALFAARGLLGAVSETVAARAGALVATVAAVAVVAVAAGALVFVVDILGTTPTPKTETASPQPSASACCHRRTASGSDSGVKT